MNKTRFRFALRAFGWHLAGSVLVAALASWVVFVLWYPEPYASLLGGTQLFLLVVAVDVVCGPLLTFVLFNPQKSKRELTLDLGLVALVQMGALLYGVHTVWLARPVYLAFELDRFRVVTYADIDPAHWTQRPAAVQPPHWKGPHTIAVRVAQSEDPDYLEQVELSVRGLEVVFRPDRWMPYEAAASTLRERAKNRDDLLAKYPHAKAELDGLAVRGELPAERLRWLPVQSRRNADWVALVDSDSLAVVKFLHLDGF